MRLLDHLRQTGTSFGDFAKGIGETENIVRKWAYRQRQPSLPRANKIVQATNGQVGFSDLLLDPAREDSGLEAEQAA